MRFNGPPCPALPRASAWEGASHDGALVEAVLFLAVLVLLHQRLALVPGSLAPLVALVPSHEALHGAGALLRAHLPATAGGQKRAARVSHQSSAVAPESLMPRGSLTQSACSPSRRSFRGTSRLSKIPARTRDPEDSLPARK